ncbi:galactokinase [Nocardioides insulae]|uniref:galactokinase n=1 Tax=Nocardioides insulae TaxID=394734 RepID=UPI000567B7F1|nr:galactokinase [Nocardioides insulae]
MSFVSPGTAAEYDVRARQGLEATFDTPATGVGRAPGRVNLIGEHTDYNRGLVLPVALPHATYAAAARREGTRFRIASAQQSEVWTGALGDAAPGRVTGWAAYAAGVVWALSEAGFQTPPMDVYIDTSVPLGAGLSSSAAIECAVAMAVLGVTDVDLDDDVRRLVVEATIRAETEVAGAPTGGMDQTVSVFAAEGQAVLIDFDDDSHTAIPLPADDHVLLVTDSRVTHTLVDGGYAARRADCEEAAAALGLPSLRAATVADVEQLPDARIRARARHIVTELDRVTATVAALEHQDWARLGELFAASHASMRDDFEISTPELDLSVATAVEAGAVGARMTGGGFGGSSVAIVPTDRVDGVARAIDVAYAAAGHPSPAHLLATPSGGANYLG